MASIPQNSVCTSTPKGELRVQIAISGRQTKVKTLRLAMIHLHKMIVQLTCLPTAENRMDQDEPAHFFFTPLRTVSFVHMSSTKGDGKPVCAFPSQAHEAAGFAVQILLMASVKPTSFVSNSYQPHPTTNRARFRPQSNSLRVRGTRHLGR